MKNNIISAIGALIVTIPGFIAIGCAVYDGFFVSYRSELHETLRHIIDCIVGGYFATILLIMFAMIGAMVYHGIKELNN